MAYLKLTEDSERQVLIIVRTLSSVSLKIQWTDHSIILKIIFHMVSPGFSFVDMMCLARTAACKKIIQQKIPVQFLSWPRSTFAEVVVLPECWMTDPDLSTIFNHDCPI